MEKKETCPKCGTGMVPSREAFHVRGTYIAHFAAMTCPICAYHYFTEEEYDSALGQAEALGLVGPPIQYTISLQEIDLRLVTLLSASLTGVKTEKKDVTENFAEKPPMIVVNPVPVPVELKIGE